MKERLKTISLLLIFALLLNMILPVVNVIATISGEVTVNFNGPWTIGEVTVDADRNGTVTLDADTEITLTNFNPDTMKAYLEASDGFKADLTVDSNGKTKISSANAGSLPTEATIEFKVSSLNSQEPEPMPVNADYEDITINATFNNARGEIVINNIRATGDTGEVSSYNGTATKAGYTDSNKTNEIRINTAFGENVASKITINNVDYVVNGTDSNTFEVAGAESYTIVVEGVEDPNAPRTIIWVNPDYVPEDEEDAEWVSQFSIEHGSAKIIAVYDENDNKLDFNEYTNQNEQPDGSKSDEYGLNKGFGWIKVKPGYKATFEFYPEYGYQLTSVAINEQPMVASATANQYTIEIPNANLHFAAKFTKTDDIVKAESEKVSSGEISLGNVLKGGTAQLTVNDVELSEDKIAGFKTAAGDYTISSYLDIDLYNVFYKGKVDSKDVWANKISELDSEATITLQLAEGVNADDIVIVHNIHDGEEYEIIEIDSYDKETNTITFKTKSFSNYAIASKTESTTTEKTVADTTNNTSKNPTTGDNIITIAMIFIISVAGLTVIKRFNRSLKNGRH